MVDFLLTNAQLVASVLLVLTLIVFIHELGHYAVAKLAGVKVTDFSIGFGPKIWGFKDGSGTEWKICWILLGGYVKFLGDSDASSTTSENTDKLSSKERQHAFDTQGLLTKSAIAVAGPMANFLSAIMIFAAFFCLYGRVVSAPEITVVEPNSIAARSGLLIGDVVVSVDDNKIDEFTDIERYVASHAGLPLNFKIHRQGQIITKKIVPESTERVDEFNNKVTVGRLGIGTSKIEVRKYGPLSAISMATLETFKICSLTLKATVQMITGSRSTQDLGGIIRITKHTAQSVKQGFVAALLFIAMFSINLGLINLFPIPPLDGGHLLLYAIEAVFSKKVSTFIKNYTIKIGMALLLALMAFAIVNDIRHL